MITLDIDILFVVFFVHFCSFFSLVEEEYESGLKDLQAQLIESQEVVKMLSVPPADVPGADRSELLRLLDRRQHEIMQLSEEWKTLSSKVVAITAEKSESQTR